MKSLKIVYAMLVIGLGTAAAAQNILVYFDGSNGSDPWAVLAQGTDGNLYGTTETGGAGCSPNGCGTVFKITPSGVLTTLYSFCAQGVCRTGKLPEAGLILATDGNFYGTTSTGKFGTRYGEVFRITPTGSFADVGFNGPYTWVPMGSLVQGIDGDLYGTSRQGGPNAAGNVFKVSPSGLVTDLYDFCSQPNCADGQAPVAGLVQATDGNFYGTTSLGGNQNAGTVFKITPQGELTTVYRFCSQPNCADSAAPLAPLVQGVDGNLYGTTNSGRGTVFKLTLAGTLTTLYTFCSQPNCTDGSNPNYAGLVQGTDGNFYGTTVEGGANNYTQCNSYPFNGCGTIYQITSSGVLTTLASFGDGGFHPEVGLMQATNGIFYGTTTNYTYNGSLGTVFSFSTGLEPFVSFVRNPAKVGQKFGILGYGLTGTTSVSLNGTPASFKIQSDTLLTASVPAGATTGYVTVATPSGVLKSNVPFRVIQ